MMLLKTGYLNMTLHIFTAERVKEGDLLKNLKFSIRNNKQKIIKIAGINSKIIKAILSKFISKLNILKNRRNKIKAIFYSFLRTKFFIAL